MATAVTSSLQPRPMPDTIINLQQNQASQSSYESLRAGRGKPTAISEMDTANEEILTYQNEQEQDSMKVDRPKPRTSQGIRSS
jgi:hypothetical protein